MEWLMGERQQLMKDRDRLDLGQVFLSDDPIIEKHELHPAVLPLVSGIWSDGVTVISMVTRLQV